MDVREIELTEGAEFWLGEYFGRFLKRDGRDFVQFAHLPDEAPPLRRSKSARKFQQQEKERREKGKKMKARLRQEMRERPKKR